MAFGVFVGGRIAACLSYVCVLVLTGCVSIKPIAGRCPASCVSAVVLYSCCAFMCTISTLPFAAGVLVCLGCRPVRQPAVVQITRLQPNVHVAVAAAVVGFWCRVFWFSGLVDWCGVLLLLINSLLAEKRC